jgi:ssDNA-binding domain of telomere protection protein
LQTLKKTDYQLPIRIRDPSLSGGPDPEYLRFKFFKREIKDLPPIGGVGDVVILKRCKQMVRINDSIFIDTYGTLAFVFKADSIPQSLLDTELSAINRQQIDSLVYEVNKPDAKVYPTHEERKYVLFLWKWIAGENKGSNILRANDAAGRPAMNSASRVVAASNQKHALLSQVQPSKFYDLTAEVVRIYQSYEKSTLYVTDYTSNNLFYDYTNEDELNQINPAYVTDESTGKKIWKGPSGKMALQITLWPPHSEYANIHLTEGSMVELRNVNVVHNKNAMNILEGKLHTDRKFEERVDVRLANEKSIVCQELIARKDAYWKKHLSPTVGLQNDHGGENAKQRKKRAKQQKKEQERRDLQEKEKKLLAGDPFVTSKVSVLNTNSMSGSFFVQI